MDKRELFEKIAEVQDLIIGLYDCVKPSQVEAILMAANGLLSVKTEIEGYYRFVPEGV